MNPSSLAIHVTSVCLPGLLVYLRSFVGYADELILRVFPFIEVSSGHLDYAKCPIKCVNQLAKILNIHDVFFMR